MDKNQAIISYLSECPALQNSPIFFNFAHAEDSSKQISTIATDSTVERLYIDGSVLRRYTFTIIDYQTVSYEAIVNNPNYPNENVEEILILQSVIDWVTEQNRLRHYPDFGDKCFVDGIVTLTDTPNINGVDTTTTPPLAKYSVTIRVQYLDKTDAIWS